MTEDQKFIAALDHIEKHAPSANAKTGVHEVRAEAFDPCATYKDIKPFVETVATGIGKIPFIGSKVETVLRTLMAIANALCG